MSKEREYLEHKKKTIIELVNEYNSHFVEQYHFKIDTDNLDIEKAFCSNCIGCGECCRKCACVYSPRDFLDITDLDYMHRILDTGLITIENYLGKYPLILRNRAISDGEKIAVTGHRGHKYCLLYSRNGCVIPHIYRASQGLLYIVHENKGHTALYKDEYYLEEYDNYDYQAALSILYEEYKDVTMPISTEMEYVEQKALFPGESQQWYSVLKEPISEEKVNEFIKCLINK